MLLVLTFWLWHWLRLRPHRRRLALLSRGRRFVPAVLPTLRARKPDWVIDEVVRLKALIPEAGCRRIADTFNRLHAARHAMTVSKTWVAVAVRARRLEIEERRREWKRRIPPPMPVNRLWGLDLTAKTDLAGRTHAILGILDHDSRASLVLRTLADKTTISVLRALLDTIEHYGKPRVVRTDNEAVFTSRLFRFTTCGPINIWRD